MGKDSEFYKDKKRSLQLKARELERELPKCAVDYLHEKEITSQFSTIVSYAYDLLTFFRFLRASNPYFEKKMIRDITVDDLALLQSEDINEFQRYLELNVEGEKHENDKRAIARKMTPLRGLYQYQLERGYIEKNPMLLVKLPRAKKDKNIIRMNNEEVRSVLGSVEMGNEQMSARQMAFCANSRQRDLAIFTLMLSTGIRVSECTGLDLNDVDLNADTITIVRKGGGQDFLYFNREVHDALAEYIEGERKRVIPVKGHETALFYSRQAKRMSVDAVERLVKKYAAMAVPGKKITPHKLRSTYGTALYRETGDIRLVADVLGHSNVNTTTTYYAAIEDEHKRRARNAVDYNQKDPE